MDVTLIKAFLGEHLPTKRHVEDAAAAVGVSIATMYRYKANPEAIDLGVLGRLSAHLGMPLENGAAWSKSDVLAAERRRLALEQGIAKGQGARFITVSPYTVNVEIPDITKTLLGIDYGIKAPSYEKEILDVRAERARLYESGNYTSWEIWNAHGYSDFFHGRSRFKSIPKAMRDKQIRLFIDSSRHPHRHRYLYAEHCPEMPMFGCYSIPGVALVRIDDIHLEFQSPDLVRSFEDTFNDLIGKCITKTADEFCQFLEQPVIG